MRGVWGSVSSNLSSNVVHGSCDRCVSPQRCADSNQRHATLVEDATGRDSRTHHFEVEQVLVVERVSGLHGVRRQERSKFLISSTNVSNDPPSHDPPSNDPPPNHQPTNPLTNMIFPTWILRLPIPSSSWSTQSMAARATRHIADRPASHMRPAPPTKTIQQDCASAAFRSFDELSYEL